MWNDDPNIDWTGDDLHDEGGATPDPTVDDLSGLTSLSTLAPEDATDILATADIAEPATAVPMAEVPAEIDVEPHFGASTDVTADSWGEEYKYLNSTGDYRGATSNREIDPWTGTEKK
jgi:hypothetical protein